MEAMSDMIENGPSANAVATPISEASNVVVSSVLAGDELQRISADVVRALKTVYDPEIPVDIYELGLIYKVDLSDNRMLTVEMTLTAPGCPVAGEMPGWVQSALRGVDGVDDIKVVMTFDPPWTAARMSDEAKLELGYL
jgi:FeS assembly SUF system protein